MGHADIQTTMRYTHHVPEADAAARVTEFVNRERGVYPTVYPIAENSKELDGTSGGDQAGHGLTAAA